MVSESSAGHYIYWDRVVDRDMQGTVSGTKSTTTVLSLCLYLSKLAEFSEKLISRVPYYLTIN